MKVVVTGGSGFIGSHLVDRLMSQGHTVTVMDNLSGGDKNFIAHHLKNKRFRFVKIDLRETAKLKRAWPAKVDVVFHLAANADIARGVEDPTLDFQHSLVATFSLLQTMHQHGVKTIVYTSGSGVYGDHGAKYLAETFGPLKPVSMYGATKLGAEGLISAFAHLFGMRACMLRPANIIGPRATHGVVFDFVGRLMKDPRQLRILGDGRQSKAYLHVSDVIDALLLVYKKGKDTVNIYNLSSESFINVNAIADVVIQEMGLKGVSRHHTPGKIGWKGDVAVIRLTNSAIKRIGWKSHYTSRQAVQATSRALLTDPRFTHD
ncbi:MAG: SDR family NAD(P)-dependent oxidoreductase [Patescibacteria group bacterium]